MRIAVISDTHLPRGARGLPEECARRIRESNLVVHAGDLVTEEALEQIQALGPPVVAVHGNVDSAGLRGLLPAARTVEADGAAIAIVHEAGPARGRLRHRFPDAAAVIFGHSHMPLHETAGDFQIFNPGSPTERRRSPHRAMGLAEGVAGESRSGHVQLD